MQRRVLASVTAAMGSLLAFILLLMLPLLTIAQQNCSTALWEVEVNGTASTDVLRATLAAAEACTDGNTTSSAASAGLQQRVLVNWAGAANLTSTLSVPQGVALEIYGTCSQSCTADSSAATNLTATTSSEAGTSAAAGNISVIDGGGQTSLFLVYGELSLANLTLRGGWDAESDCGGAVGMRRGANFSSEDCVWESHYSPCGGGAIYSTENSTVVMRGNNDFRDCTSSGGGGALLVDRGSKLEIATGGITTIEGCDSTGKGGGMLMYDGASLQLSEGARMEFLDCHGEDDGGGLYVASGTVEVMDDAYLGFSGCVTGPMVDSHVYGGGLHAASSTVYIGRNAELSFVGNSVPGEGDGGGMYGLSSSMTVDDGAVVSAVDNSVTGGGAGLSLHWIQEDASKDNVKTGQCLTLASGSTSTFVDNIAEEYGAGAYFGRGCEVDFSGEAYFEGGVAQRAGAIYGDIANVTMSGTTTFFNNTALRWGGAVMMLDSPLGGLFFTGGTIMFINNTAGRSGGGIYLENSGVYVTTAEDAPPSSDIDAVFSGNLAKYDGGVVAVDGGTVELNGGRYLNNTAWQRGGVLFATGESTVEWISGHTEDNEATAGGALHMGDGSLYLKDVTMSGDSTPSGAVIFLANADAIATNVSIVAPAKQWADVNSGAFALHVDSKSMFRGLSCAFKSWDYDGSAAAPVVLAEGQVILDSCDFSGSSASRLLQASNTPPTILRNAIVGKANYLAAGYNDTEDFAAGVRSCDCLPEAYACLESSSSSMENFTSDDGGCIDAADGMGVLCSSFAASATDEITSLSGSSSLELTLENTSNSDVFFYPDAVSKVRAVPNPLGLKGGTYAVSCCCLFYSGLEHTLFTTRHPLGIRSPLLPSHLGIAVFPTVMRGQRESAYRAQDQVVMELSSPGRHAHEHGHSKTRTLPLLENLAPHFPTGKA